ncbi:GHMP family kinase ATP-binding protein [Prosthecomicrobium sp. N25]|uniref:GHMP family kinase ATP-binding protein n=1 Tax=Prosthecomicrobium sp. N25 TaxID=3129254 RepID=UPI003076A8AE
MLTIARSPLRVSFFGGGTDYPAYFREFPGAVLGSSINKYIYIVTLPMVGYAETRFRVTYRMVETVDRIEDIKHNAIRATLQDCGYDEPLNIAIISDLPGNSGLGSSSAFTVGFVRLIEHLSGRKITKYDLMRKAVRIEHDLLQENVGIQDQTHAAFGGLSLYTFQGDDFAIQPIRMKTENRDALNESLCLVYTGLQRSASQTLDEQVRRTAEGKIRTELRHLVDLCREGLRILENDDAERLLADFGRLLSEGWETKRKLSSAITTPRVDEIYEVGMKLGAYGGKLCGAGGGGFFMFLAPPECQKRLAEAFGPQNFVKIETEDEGARIVTR